MTNESTVVNVSSHLDNDLIQGEEISNEILLSVDEISDLLAHDFERYANLSKDACILKCYANSCGEVSSPKFDVEEDVVLEYAMSTLGGVCDGSLYVNAPNDFHVEKKSIEIRSDVGSLSFCFHKTERNSDSSCDKESNSNGLVYSSELFEGIFDMDQHVVRRQFHYNSCDLVSNQLFECEENITYIQSDVWCVDIVNEEKSDFTFSSYSEAQGELQFGSCNLLNEVEYQAFVFSIERVHDSGSSDQFQFDVSCCDHFLHFNFL